MSPVLPVLPTTATRYGTPATRPPRALRRLGAALAALATAAIGALVLAGAAPAAAATLGHAVLPATTDDEPMTVFYPSRSPAGPLRLGFVTLTAAPDGEPEAGNGRLVVVSHGTGGGVPVHTALARTLVEQGFTVAIPLHRGDHTADHRTGTFDSIRRRPAEVSRAIDRIGQDPRWAGRLRLGRVGVYGMSAGGFTALVLAGGRWSPQRFVDHCDRHLAADFQFCTGVITRLTGGWLDGLKLAVARAEIRRRFGGDTVEQGHTDPRIAAIVAAVPAAAPIDLATLARPVAALGLVTMGQDRWLVPAFHGEAVLAACPRCERVGHLDDGGHGAMLAPPPPGLGGVLGDLLNDPPGFDRTRLPAVDRAIAGFFERQLTR
jgi:predicted dienelactone hydrolase